MNRSNDNEEAGLLLPRENSQTVTAPNYLRSVGIAGLVVGALMLFVGGAKDSSPSSSSLLDSTTQMTQVYNILASGKNKYTFECDVPSYAYCGHATCSQVDDSSSLCGCELKNDMVGRFMLDSASLTLIQSPTYRQAVIEAHAGEMGKANTTVCNALKDNTIWAEAGYDTSLGSFFDPDGDTTTDFRDIESLSTVREFGSCMGSPCYENLSWGGDCDVVCLCPTFTDGTKDDDDSCFLNAVAESSDLAWSDSYDELESVVAAIQSKFGSITSDDLSSSCTSTCSVL